MLYQQKIWQVSEMSWFSQKIRCVSKNFLSYQNAPFPLLSLGGERRRGGKGREGQTKWREWFRDIVYDDIKSLFVYHEQHVIVNYHNISKIHTEITIKALNKLKLTKVASLIDFLSCSSHMSRSNFAKGQIMLAFLVVKG